MDKKLKQLREAWELNEAGGKKIVDKLPATLVLEEQIVRFLNGRIVDKRVKPSIETIVNKARKLGIEPSAVHTGRNLSDTTEYYNKRFKLYGGKQISRTPKTDLFTNDKKYRVSLKGPSGGWLFAHKVVDSKICFDHIADNTRLTNILTSRVNKYLETMIKVSPPEAWVKGDKGISLKDLKFYLNDSAYNELEGVYESIEGVFRSDEFKEEFVRHGVSGLFKFGDNFGHANKMLSVSGRTTGTSTEKMLFNASEVGRVSLVDLEKGDITQLVDRIQPKFLFKDGALHMWVKKGAKGVNESIIEEGVLDWIKIGSNKAKEYIVKIYNYMKELVSKGVSFVLNKLGIVPNIEFNNEF